VVTAIDISPIRDLYPFEAHYHQLKGYDYHYVDEGSGEPIVMVHGNPSWSFLFRNLILGLRDSYRVLAPDHLGFGLSDKPPKFPYRLETHIDNFEEFMLARELEGVTLLAHDWGGPIALGFAVRHPEKIKRIVISNTAAFASSHIPLRLALGKIPWLGEKLIKDMNLFLTAAMTATVEKPLDSQVKLGYKLPFRKASDRTAMARFVRDIPMGPEHPSFEVLLGIEHGLWMFRDVPVCVIWGMKDWCFDSHFLERWIDVFPHADVLELDNAGHWLFEDAHDEILPFLRHFLEES
jgi:haloalkane dehalogenase